MQAVGCHFFNEHRISSCLPSEKEVFWGVYLAFSPEEVFESSHTWMEVETGGGPELLFFPEKKEKRVKSSAAEGRCISCVLIMESDTKCILDILPSHFYSKIECWLKNNELYVQLMLVCICVCALRGKRKQRHSLFLCCCSLFLLITSFPIW